MSEISGIIKNGLQRGWPPQEIYRSLINSGYNSQDVQLEINKFSTNIQNISLASPQDSSQKLAPYQLPAFSEKKSAGKGLVIGLIILAVLVVLGGASLILFGPK